MQRFATFLAFFLYAYIEVNNYLYMPPQNGRENGQNVAFEKKIIKNSCILKKYFYICKVEWTLL